MQPKKSLKYKIGLGLIGLSFISPILAFLVPFLNLSTTASSTIIAFLMIGFPEILLIAGGALAGKEALDSIKSKFLKPAGKIRYMTGLTLFIGGALINWVLIYLVLADIVQTDQHSLLITVGSIDIISITGILMMGVEFFAKCKRLFIWEGDQS